jgi:hypothetical protein
MGYFIVIRCLHFDDVVVIKPKGEVHLWMVIKISLYFFVMLVNNSYHRLDWRQTYRDHWRVSSYSMASFSIPGSRWTSSFAASVCPRNIKECSGVFFWVLAPCRLTSRCQRFGETYCLHLQDWTTSSSPPWNPQISLLFWTLSIVLVIC